jgi:predicted dehydrogenase
MQIGLVGIEGDHAEDALRLFNRLGRFPGFAVAALWGAEADAGRTQLLASTYGAGSIVAEPEAMLGKVDAVIVGDRDGSRHAAHALPFLEAGIPVFVDKPLACSVADAEAMLDAARTSGALLLSGSALRWQADAWDLKRQVAAKGQTRKITATGTFYPESPYGGAAFYAVHTVELALEFAGQGIEEIVVTEATGDRLTIVGRAPLGEVEMRCLRPSHGEAARFEIALEAQHGNVVGEIALPRDYMAPVYEHFVTMLKRGVAPLSRGELLAPVRVLEAAGKALAAGA